MWRQGAYHQYKLCADAGDGEAGCWREWARGRHRREWGFCARLVRPIELHSDEIEDNGC